MASDAVHEAFGKITRILQKLSDEEQRRIVNALNSLTDWSDKGTPAA